MIQEVPLGYYLTWLMIMTLPEITPFVIGDCGSACSTQIYRLELG